MIIKLNESEVHFLRTIASTRSFFSRRRGVVDQKFASDKSGFEIDFDVCLSEYAFCKWHNINFSLSFGDDTAGQPDCIYKNLTIDIKSTRLKNGRLVVKLNPIPVDMYVLAIVQDDYTIFFPGYINAKGHYNKDGVSNVVSAMISEIEFRINLKYNSSDPLQLTRRKAETAFTIQDAIMKRDGSLYPTDKLNDVINEINLDPKYTDDM